MSSSCPVELKDVQQIKASASACAALLADGSVVTWGRVDSSQVQEQLRHVQRIFATRLAFAALLADGSVVCWGDRFHGGDCSAVQEQLKDVQQTSLDC